MSKQCTEQLIYLSSIGRNVMVLALTIIEQKMSSINMPTSSISYNNINFNVYI